jgi:mRNA-degrading endonuclease toxin of MazEF toxin-antitoxin module
MGVSQREIVEVNYLLPNGKFKAHPLIVISNKAVFEAEGIFYGAMISTKYFNDEFAFEIMDEMLTKPMKAKSYIKCQLIQSYEENEILSRHGTMKKQAFDKLLKKIFESVFIPTPSN